MKKHFTIPGIASFLLFLSAQIFAQDEPISTIFKPGSLRGSGGYGTIVNKFTTIDGKFANFVELYGGWYINHKFLIGAGGGSTTNFIQVPDQYKMIEGVRMTYEYGQCGLVTEYVIASNRAVHVAFHLFTGAGFTLQYERPHWRDYDRGYERGDNVAYDQNWFVVVEPGIQAELNLLKWMRFCPGVSYRTTYGSSAAGLKDKDMSAFSVNLAMKFGKF
jgi:hypothetical protein